VTIVVNGKAVEAEESTRLSEFISARRLQPETVIVELNEKVVRKDAWEKTLLAEGDCIELVSLVGGG
jgi:thiamine biosynthesis protein ThiS